MGPTMNADNYHKWWWWWWWLCWEWWWWWCWAITSVASGNDSQMQMSPCQIWRTEKLIKKNNFLDLQPPWICPKVKCEENLSLKNPEITSERQKGSMQYKTALYYCFPFFRYLFPSPNWNYLEKDKFFLVDLEKNFFGRGFSAILISCHV